LLAVPLGGPVMSSVMPRWRNACAPSPLRLPTAFSRVAAQSTGALLNPPSGMTNPVTSGGPSSRYPTLMQKQAWRCRKAVSLNRAVNPACTAEGWMI